MRRFIGVLLAVTLGSCGHGGNSCVDGESAACACTNGRTGAQVCANGKFATCVCDDDDSTDMSSADLASRDLSGASTEDLAHASSEDLAPSTSKRVFLTSQHYTGDLVDAALVATNGGPIADGLAAGDALCQKAASGASLGGTWKAWLSDSTTDAISRIADVGPWKLVGGTLVFASKAALTSSPAIPINRDETGTYIPSASAMVWTGSQTDGTKAPSRNCSDWTIASDQGNTPNGELGGPYATDTMSPGAWSGDGDADCLTTYTASLYCFEQ